MNLRRALLAAAALAAASTSPALCRWGCGENCDLLAIARAVRRGDELDARREAGLRHDEAKRALAAEVVAGRMSLREAAEHFRRLDEADPAYPAGLPRLPRDERFFCERVLDFVWEALARKELFVAAARWYGEAFTDHPHLLAGPPAGQHYYAARSAALAGCGQGQDAAELDEETCAAFRRQALVWLRAEMKARHRQLEQEPEKAGPTVALDLQDWLRDHHFDGVRGPEALARLPAAERQEWQKLWADIADALARAVGMLPR
jgi:hypothetical protein